MTSEAFTTICHSDDREPWLAKRRDGIGSSDAAAVLGDARWGSRMSVFADKVLPLEPEESVPEWIVWGRKLEPLIIEAFAEETGRKVERDGALIRSKAHPFMQATLDARQWRDDRDGPGFLEVKNSRFGMPHGVPRDYWIQCQHHAAVSGFSWGSFAVLVMGSAFYWCDVDVERGFIEETLIPECARFWSLVQNRGPQPSAEDASPATRQALARFYPEDNGETKGLPGELVELDDEREAIGLQLRELQQREEAIKNRFRQAIGEASVGILPNGRTWTYRANKKGVRSLRAPALPSEEEVA